MMGDDCCPSRKSHPFWKAAVGSVLELTLVSLPLGIAPVETAAFAPSQVRGMTLRVHSGSPHVRSGVGATTYRLQSHFVPPYRGNEVFCNRREARRILKREWMRHYRDRTCVEYIERKAVDMEELVKELMRLENDTSSADTSRASSPTSSPSSSSSSPTSPSFPQFLCTRRISIPTTPSSSPSSPAITPRTSGRKSSSNTPSPRSADGSPRAPDVYVSSRDSSPRSPMVSPKGLGRSSNSLLSELLVRKREKYATLDSSDDAIASPRAPLSPLFRKRS